MPILRAGMVAHTFLSGWKNSLVLDSVLHEVNGHIPSSFLPTRVGVKVAEEVSLAYPFSLSPFFVLPSRKVREGTFVFTGLPLGCSKVEHIRFKLIQIDSNHFIKHNLNKKLDFDYLNKISSKSQFKSILFVLIIDLYPSFSKVNPNSPPRIFLVGKVLLSWTFFFGIPLPNNLPGHSSCGHIL